jgi:hypothetical protein
VIRPATHREVISFYGRVGVPVRMLVIEVAGEVLGVCGLAWCDDGVHAVSFLKPEAKRHPKEIMRAAHRVQAMCEEAGVVVAEPDPDEPTAEAFRSHIGFIPEGGAYVYRPDPR